MRGQQIALQLEPPEPIQARQKQRDAERDRTLDALSAVNARKVADHFREAAKALDALAISIPENGHTSSDAE